MDMELLQAIGQMMDEKLKQELAPLKSDIADLKESLQIVRNSQMKVELEQYPRIAAALDGVVGGIEKNKEQDNRLSVLESKTDNHGTRIWALEQVVKEA